jgi:hypothetical protein
LYLILLVIIYLALNLSHWHLQDSGSQGESLGP